MGAWLTRHAQTSIGSLGRLSQHKLATLLTVLVIGIALALPACLHLLISNAQTATGNWNRAVDLTVLVGRVEEGEVDAAGDAKALLHRRQVIGAVDIVDRPRQAGAGCRLEMAVIAALDIQFRIDPERLQEVTAPGAERYDHDVGFE